MTKYNFVITFRISNVNKMTVKNDSLTGSNQFILLQEPAIQESPASIIQQNLNMTQEIKGVENLWKFCARVRKMTVKKKNIIL